MASAAALLTPAPARAQTADAGDDDASIVAGLLADARVAATALGRPLPLESSLLEALRARAEAHERRFAATLADRGASDATARPAPGVLAAARALEAAKDRGAARTAARLLHVRLGEGRTDAVERLFDARLVQLAAGALGAAAQAAEALRR